MAPIMLSGPGLQLIFEHSDSRLHLRQMRKDNERPFLYKDPLCAEEGAGMIGNPLTVVVHDGEYEGMYGMDSFHTTHVRHDERKMLAFLAHDIIPMQAAIEVEVEGNVATWRGQVCWTGSSDAEADIYYPFFSRVAFDSPDKDRAILARLSGSTLDPLGSADSMQYYIGNLSCPAFLAEGGGRGLALLDDNRADYAADPGACTRRAHVVGNTFPPKHKETVPFKYADIQPTHHGPFLGILHSRRFNAVNMENEIENLPIEAQAEQLPFEVWAGEAVDLGPVHIYAYSGSWKIGASWLREKRRHVPFRKSPAEWYRQTTFIAEHMGDELVRDGQSFYDYPAVIADKERLGSNLFHLPGYHDPVVLGSSKNWLNRGDYFYAAQSLGGFEAVKKGIETVHRRGGRILYYIEGLIKWRFSRIGMSKAKKWALMDQDGSYTDHYKGFWHMCPACEEWQNWIADTCAEIVKTTAADGFFIDSLCATHNHRCYNPEHRHPHPDIWNWGVRRLLRKIRNAVDQVNPDTVLFVEGGADLAREYADGSISHSHAWMYFTTTEPLVRFLHPEMRIFESWSNERFLDFEPALPIKQIHLWNAVNGHRIYSHNPDRDEMEALSIRTRRYYDAFPEICDGRMSALDVAATDCIAQLFEGDSCVITVGNPSDQAVIAALRIPVPAGLLFDRVEAKRIPVYSRTADIALTPWEFRAFEVRP